MTGINTMRVLGSGEIDTMAKSQEQTDKLEAAHELLTSAVRDLASGEGWRQMLTTAARFHHYSPNNVLLITIQKPEATIVAGYQTWQKLNRQVRKGEKGIAILAPMVRKIDTENDGEQTSAKRVVGFRVTHVFDISQTDGDEIETGPKPVLLDGQAPEGLHTALALMVEAEGFELVTGDLAMYDGANGLTDYTRHTVTIRDGLSDAQSVKTLAHELGHVLLHAPAVRPENLTRQQAEVEAESVAYMVGAAHGLDTMAYTVPYVAGWSGGDVELLRLTAERVLTTARKIISQTVEAAADTLVGAL